MLLGSVLLGGKPKPMATWKKAILIASGAGALVAIGVAIAPAAPMTLAVAGKMLAKARWS